MKVNLIKTAIFFLVGTFVLQSNSFAADHRSFCKFGHLNDDTCGCKCDAPYVLSGKNCVCPATVCQADILSVGTANPDDSCTCSCVWDIYKSILPSICPAYGAVYDAGKCGCSCAAPKKLSTTTWRCECPLHPDCSLDGKVFNDDTCSCQCAAAKIAACTSSGGQMSTNCECGGCTGDKVVVDGKCQCPNAGDPVGAHMKFNDAICKSDCENSDYQKAPSGTVCYHVDCKDGKADNKDVCAPDDMIYYPGSGTCACPVNGL